LIYAWKNLRNETVMQKKILSAILIFVIVSSVGLAAAQVSTPSPNARDIKVGLVAPVGKSPVGADMYRAAQLAVKEINDAGGVHVAAWNTNVNITLDLADTIDDAPGNAVSPVTRAVTVDNVDLLIGGYGSAGTLANEVVAIENKVPFIITGASNQLVTRRGPQGNYGGLSPTDPQAITDAEGMSYIFHYCTTTYHYSKTVVDFFATVMKPMVAADRNFSLAILFRDDAFGNGVEQATKFWIQNESLPITIVSDLKYPTSTTDFQTQLTQTKGANPDAVFVVDNPDRTPVVVKQGLNDVGLKTVYIAVENNEDPVFYDLMGQGGSGQLLESKFAPFAGPPYYLPEIGTYVAKYNSTYNAIPGMMGADTYDAFFIAKAAIESAGTLDKAAVRTAIEQINIDDMLIMTQNGKIQFSTGVNYHEIQPITFIEQLIYNATTNKCTSQIVWPSEVTGIGVIKQAGFVLPAGYPVASPAATQSSAPTTTPDNTSNKGDSTMIYIIAAIAVIVIVAVVAVVLVKKRKK
jgi:branched-chain amino acid transport system substrate-binding protein